MQSEHNQFMRVSVAQPAFCAALRCFSVPDWERARAPDPPSLHGAAQPGRRQAVKAEAAKRGRDSARLCGLTPVRFAVASSKRI